MANNHLKRLAAPKTWQIERKGPKFVLKPVPGPHKIELSMPLGIILKEILKQANTLKEVKKILNSGGIKVDGVERNDFRFPIGIFDVIQLTTLDENYRVILNRRGKISLIKIGKEESSTKPCKITGKTMVKGKLQLNLYDGKSILVDNNSYKVGDTIILSLPENKISKHIKLDRKSAIILIGGKHIGEVGNVDEIIERRVVYKDENGELVETSKDYAFVVGDTKPLMKLN